MSYDVGTHVDLRHLNGGLPVATFQQTAEDNLQEVGTSYKFTDKLRPARRIPVVAL